MAPAALLKLRIIVLVVERTVVVLAKALFSSDNANMSKVATCLVARSRRFHCSLGESVLK